MEKIKMIKKDAIVDIKIGAGFISRLNEILMQLTTDKNKEDLEKYRKEAEENKGFSEPWMESATTVGILLREIQNEAEKQGMTYETTVDEVTKELKDLISEEIPTEE